VERQIVILRFLSYSEINRLKLLGEIVFYTYVIEPVLVLRMTLDFYAYP
jgi:hypothetical protein